jgi:ABC-type enterobactin transport system permease subunit
VVDALFSHDDTKTDHLIVQSLRVPRTVVGLLVGVALGLAGAVMQGVARNPLADPGILGVNAGAALAVVIGIYVFGIGTLLGYVWFAFAGAAVASVVVYGLGSMGREGATPVKLALAGAAITAFLASITTAILIIDIATLDQYRFWAVGSLAGRDGDIARQVAPFIVVGAVMALAAGRLAERAGARRRRGPIARPAGRPARLFSAARWCCSSAPRWPRPGRSASSGSRCRTSPGPSPDPTTGGCCRTRWCWPRSCCSAPT